MVRGSGHDPVTSESKSTKVLYDRTIERWEWDKYLSERGVEKKNWSRARAPSRAARTYNA